MTTIAEALAAARHRAPGTPGTIRLPAGTCFLEEPIVLGPADSGLTIEADGEVTLYGGRPITGWQRDGDTFWSAPLAGVAAGRWDFRMLVVNGRFCPRARFPREGFLQHLSEWAVPWMSTTGGGWKTKPTPEQLSTMRYAPGDLPPELDLRNAELTVYHMWDESGVGIAARDLTTYTLTFATPAGHPPGAFGVRKYVVWNVREGMTQPGQWYLDRSAGKVFYWPLPGEDMAAAEVIAPTMESIIRLQGTEEEPVRDVTLRGLTLSVTNTPLKAGGFGAGLFEGALSIDRAEGCHVEDCTIVNVGGQGIRGSAGTGLRIARCHVHHTGACGIRCGGTDGTVEDCHIHDVGVAYPSAIALWVCGRDTHGWRVEHNHIHDTPYTAIAASGATHHIGHNLIHDAMKELHDGAGIYITFCRDIVLRGNFIRDISDTGGFGASAYYLDEQAENCLVEGNFALRVGWPSHNHMALRNTIRNNIFICDADAKVTLPRSREYTFERNVLVADGKITITNPDGISVLRGNLFYSRQGEITGVPLRDYAPGEPQPLTPGPGFTSADPHLTGYKTGKLRLAPDSPAIQLGINPIDVSQAGIR